MPFAPQIIPKVSSYVFVAWDCAAYVYDDAADVVHLQLRADPAVRCSDPSFSSEKHEEVVQTAFALLWLWWRPARRATLSPSAPPCARYRPPASASQAPLLPTPSAAANCGTTRTRLATGRPGSMSLPFLTIAFVCRQAGWRSRILHRVAAPMSRRHPRW